jgi:hypothetical protein
MLPRNSNSLANSEMHDGDDLLPAPEIFFDFFRPGCENRIIRVSTIVG